MFLCSLHVVLSLKTSGIKIVSQNGLLENITFSIPQSQITHYNICISIPADLQFYNDKCAGNEADERVKLPLSQINELKKLTGAKRM